jgi:hypothetical protein
MGNTPSNSISTGPATSSAESPIRHQSIRDIPDGKITSTVRKSTPVVSDKQPIFAKVDSATSPPIRLNLVDKKSNTSKISNTSSSNETKKMENNISGIPGHPMNLAKLALGNMNTNKTPGSSGQNGGFDAGFSEADTEIQVNVVPLNTFGHSFKGGAPEMSESAIDVQFTDFDGTQAGGNMYGGAGSDFDSNKLLKSIMQMGGGNNSDSDFSTESSIASSSYDARPVKTGRNGRNGKNKKTSKSGMFGNESAKERATYSDSFDDSDDSSSSSDDSNTFSTDSIMDFNTDSAPVDFEYISKQNKKSLKKINKYKTGSDLVSDNEVYVLTDSSDRVGGVTLRSFANPLANSRSKSSNKSRKSRA